MLIQKKYHRMHCLYFAVLCSFTFHWTKRYLTNYQVYALFCLFIRVYKEKSKPTKQKKQNKNRLFPLELVHTTSLILAQEGLFDYSPLHSIATPYSVVILFMCLCIRATAFIGLPESCCQSRPYSPSATCEESSIINGTW